MIPITTIKGTVVGFILRSVLGSDYCSISRDFNSPQNKVPLMFGFDKCFENFDKRDKCFPIILCEGSKDCIFLKKFYPYTLAINTNSMGFNVYILINISNKFILAYDNDKAGQEGIARDKKILRRYGAQVVSLDLDKTLDNSGKFLMKDCSDYINHPNKINSLKEEIKYKLKRVSSF